MNEPDRRPTALLVMEEERRADVYPHEVLAEIERLVHLRRPPSRDSGSPRTPMCCATSTCCSRAGARPSSIPPSCPMPPVAGGPRRRGLRTASDHTRVLGARRADRLRGRGQRRAGGGVHPRSGPPRTEAGAPHHPGGGEQSPLPAQPPGAGRLPVTRGPVGARAHRPSRRVPPRPVRHRGPRHGSRRLPGHRPAGGRPPRRHRGTLRHQPCRQPPRPLLPETRGTIGSRLLNSLGPGATLINTARGALIDETAAAEVLRARPDLTAVLDVTHPEPPAHDSPLFTLPNVVLTPHLGGALGAERHRLGALVLDELRRFIHDQPLQHAIDPDRATTLA